MQRLPIGYQIYSAREEAAKDLGSVLSALKAMGYDGVEFAGFYEYDAATVASLLKETGLKAISSHVPFQRIVADMDGVIAYHNTIDCPYIAIPYLDDKTRPGAPGFAYALQVIYEFAGRCKAAGIQLLYHNHDFEFVEVSGQYGLDFIYDAVPANLLQTEIDCCWVKYAGLVPAEYIQKYAGRCPIVHLKDYVGRRSEQSPYGLIGQDEAKKDNQAFEFRPFGHGSQNAREIIETSIACGATWFVVEQDLAHSRTPLEAAKMSIDTVLAIYNS